MSLTRVHPEKKGNISHKKGDFAKFFLANNCYTMRVLLTGGPIVEDGEGVDEDGQAVEHRQQLQTPLQLLLLKHGTQKHQSCAASGRVVCEGGRVW